MKRSEFRKNSDVDPNRSIKALTFRDWWHLTARYTSVIEANEPIRMALRIVAHRGFRHIPVVLEGRTLQGIVTAGDLIEFLIGATCVGENDSLPLEALTHQPRLNCDHVMASLAKPVTSLARSEPMTIHPDGTILSAIKMMSEKNIGSLIIVEEDNGKTTRRLVGIVTLRDLISILSSYAPFGIRVEDCMTRKVATIDESDSIYDAMSLMAKEKIRRLPIVRRSKNNESGEALLGLVTNKMILRYLESIISYEFLDLSRALGQPVKMTANSQLPTIDPREDCGNAAFLMREVGTGGFVVRDSREMVGVITERDLIRGIYLKKGLSFFSELFDKGDARMRA